MPKVVQKMLADASPFKCQTATLYSEQLGREVIIDIYLPPFDLVSSHLSLLLVNDGQDLRAMDFSIIIDALYRSRSIQPVCCVGIHAGTDRRNEYGTAGVLDYLGRGGKAQQYTSFVLQELLPAVRHITGLSDFRDKSFCGFSLGGLSALDIVWNHPKEFRNVGVFSGSLWWRSRALEDGYDEARDRIMHAGIQRREAVPWLRFFLQAGMLDETADRNGNGVIDSIDDTRDLVRELLAKGYSLGTQILHLELPEGRHDIATWGATFPAFLNWAFGK